MKMEDCVREETKSKNKYGREMEAFEYIYSGAIKCSLEICKERRRRKGKGEKRGEGERGTYILRGHRHSGRCIQMVHFVVFEISR